MNLYNRTDPSTQTGAVNRQAVIVGGAVVLVVLVALFLFYPRTGLPPESEEPPVATETERGEAAREAIADLQESAPDDFARAYERGRDFRSEGRLADAQLMYFYAARGGDPQAAFELAAMHDPNHHSADSSLMDEPDAFQAYKWYTQAREGGVSEADRRLAALREWTEQQAREGNPDAEQLLLQWD